VTTVAPQLPLANQEHHGSGPMSLTIVEATLPSHDCQHRFAWCHCTSGDWFIHLGTSS
jgi:hypothetical protein